MSEIESSAAPDPPPVVAAAEPVCCCECGDATGVDYNVRNGKPYCFPCFYAEEGGD